MTERIFGTVPQEEREKLLHSHSVKFERTTFTQALTDDELQIESAEYIRGSIDLDRMESQAKEASDEWKKKIKKREGELEESLDRIKQGRREVTGVLFHIPNHAEQKMLLYNKYGELIDTRPLKEEEKQARAFIDGPGGTVANPDDQITDIEHEEVDPEKAIDEMYAGPTIAGSAEENGMKFSDTETFENLPEGHIPGSAGFDYESREQETQGSRAAADENGMAWDDPRQTRTEPDGKATEEGAKAAKRGRKPKAKE